jgi:hypothetical protein
MLDVSRDIRYGIDDCVCNDCGALIRTDPVADVDRFYNRPMAIKAVAVDQSSGAYSTTSWV